MTTTVERLHNATRLAEAYLVLNRITDLDDANAKAAKEELIESIKEAEGVIIRDSIWKDAHL